MRKTTPTSVATDVATLLPDQSLDDSLVTAFFRSVRDHPDDVALRAVDGSRTIRWREYADLVARLAAGLGAVGCAPGDRLAILAGNRPEWQVTDMAALVAGAIPFSLYVNVPVEQTRQYLSDTGARVLVVERRFLDTLAGTDVAQVRCVVVLDGQPGDAVTGIRTISWTELLSIVPSADLGEPTIQPRPDDVATLIFTSGTTGRAKQVQLTHANVLFMARQFAAIAGMGRGRPGRLVSYLPHAHIVDRLIGHYLGLVTGATTTTVLDARTVFSQLPAIRPTLFTSVPRLWEGLRGQLEQRLATADGPEDLTDTQRTALRNELGLDACDWLVTGSAPLSPGTHEFFAAVGLPLCDVWGLSESTAAAAGNLPGARRAGTVGRALPGTEVAIAPDGEVLLRGPHIMLGYRDNPAANAEAFTADGWYRTGDLGRLDDGWLTLIGRKKELLITQGGENVAPARVEGIMLDSSPLITQVCVVGDGEPYLTALIVVNPAATDWYRDAAGLRDAVAAAVDSANQKLSRAERIRRFAMLDAPFTAEDGQLTPTLKLRRSQILDQYAVVIRSLYSDG